MKLYVPEIGDKLKLLSDWTFDLHWEHRNAALLKHFFNVEFTWGRENVAPRLVTLPAGTEITVDRIYIRQGASEYSSITFYAAIGESGKGSFGKPKNPRFWATLKDCNKIEFEVEKSAPSLKLIYNIRKPGYYAGRGRNELRPTSDKREGDVFKVISARNSVPVMKVKIEIEIKWEQKLHTWESHYHNPKYTLLTLSGEEVGSWKSLATLKKHAKEYVTLHNL